MFTQMFSVSLLCPVYSLSFLCLPLSPHSYLLTYFSCIATLDNQELPYFEVSPLTLNTAISQSCSIFNAQRIKTISMGFLKQELKHLFSRMMGIMHWEQNTVVKGKRVLNFHSVSSRRFQEWLYSDPKSNANFLQWRTPFMGMRYSGGMESEGNCPRKSIH